MSKSPFVFLVAAVVLCQTMAVSASDGWKMPNLNPFQSQSGRNPNRSSQGSSWWNLPKLPSLSSSTPRRNVPRQPSMFSKMTRGTKSALSKTYDVLTPWDNNQPKKPHAQINSGGASSGSRGGFFSWFSAEEEPRKPTVNEWLNQPRP